MVFHSHLLLVLAPTITLFNFAPTFLASIFYVKLCPFISKQFSIDSFLELEGLHWVFFSTLQTETSDSFLLIFSMQPLETFDTVRGKPGL